MKKILILACAVLVLAILLTGCTSQPVPPVPVATPVVTTAVPVATVTPGISSSFPTGVNWRLFSYSDGIGGMANVIGEQPVTALFRSDGTVTGSSGCNQYTAGYTTSGSSIQVTNGSSTGMACIPAVMGQESRYILLMANATTYSVNGDTMVFFDRSGKATLAYKRPLEGAVNQPVASPVVGSWDLQTYYNGNNAVVSVLPGSNISAVFSPDGKINGLSGCNEYSALYSLHDITLGISQVKTAKKACDPDLMTQENQYLALLERVNTYETKGDQMVLITAMGQKVLTFRKGIAGADTPSLQLTPSPFTGTLTGTWALKSYTDGKGGSVAVMTGSPVTAKFNADGSLSGSAGCNQYSTTYSISGASISISQTAATKQSCDPETMAQEHAYLTLLPVAGKFAIFGDSMVLYNSNGQVLLNYKAA